MRASVLLSLALFNPAAFAAEEPKTAPERLRDVLVLPGQGGYTQELAQTGVQGTALVLTTLGDDGKPKNVALHESSRSAELDAAALALVRGLSYKINATTAGPVPPFIVPVAYQRDSIETMAKKKCAEYNVDLAYFKSKFPDKPATELPGWNMTVGMLVMMMPSQSRMAFIKRLRDLPAEVATACQERPDAGYIDVLTGKAKSFAS